MELEFDLRPGANRFVSEAGALAYLDTILKDFTKPVVITGEKSFAAFEKAIRAHWTYRFVTMTDRPVTKMAMLWPKPSVRRMLSWESEPAA